MCSQFERGAPKLVVVEMFTFGSTDAGGLRLNAQMICFVPSGGACARRDGVK